MSLPLFISFPKVLYLQSHCWNTNNTLELDPITWNKEHVGAYLIKQGLGFYVPHFNHHAITGNILFLLNEKDLKAMKIRGVARKKILQKLALLHVLHNTALLECALSCKN